MALDIEKITEFETLNLSEPILQAIAEQGYFSPTPIQAEVIPVFMTGKDLVGQAQTGTGKTAAFALPVLEKIDLSCCEPQVLVLTPTRELANQVRESFKKYAVHLEGLRTVAIYGGLEYGSQLRAFARGVHVVVGTPGRVMDHIDRGTLKLASVKTIVLDEADEMLNMGFKEDVEWILERAPKERQIALFSATMPEDIRDLARRFMNEAKEITIKQRTATVENTRQRYWQITGLQKIDALSRLLEAENYDAVLVFVSRKIDTLEVADQLSARGFEVAALNGDLPQNQRERIIEQLKNGRLNIVVATDVAARGLDVDRISHVINYDLPQDQESYIHRIGRTGRAGRKGEAIIFVSQREKRWLSMLEKTTRQPIEEMQMPTASFICDRRIERFKAELSTTIEVGKLEFFRNLIDKYCHEAGLEPMMVAAALAKLLQKSSPLQISEQKEFETKALKEFEPGKASKSRRGSRRDNEPEEGMVSYRVEVGRSHGVQPGNIVGAIAGETGMSSRYIGRIKIMDDFSVVDLPEDMPQELLDKLKNVYVCHRMLHIAPDRFNRPLVSKETAPKAEERIKVEMFFNNFVKKAERVEKAEKIEKTEKSKNHADEKNIKASETGKVKEKEVDFYNGKEGKNSEKQSSEKKGKALGFGKKAAFNVLEQKPYFDKKTFSDKKPPFEKKSFSNKKSYLDKADKKNDKKYGGWKLAGNKKLGKQGDMKQSGRLKKAGKVQGNKPLNRSGSRKFRKRR